MSSALPSKKNNTSCTQTVKYPQDKRSFLERILELVLPGPDSKADFFEILQQAKERDIIDDDGVAMIEGVLQVSELCAGDIMIPKAQIDTVNIDDDLRTILPFVIAKAHSRFPVLDKDHDKIIGILLAKDLLRAHIDTKFDWREHLRPVVYIPKSKPLNVLLKEFRLKKNHIAIIVDEYSEVVGLLTIEDVIEQITGDIEDEHDYDEDNHNIIQSTDGDWRVKGSTEIEQFNAHFNTSFSDSMIDTVAGLINNYFGRIPHKGEVALIDNVRFEVLRTDARQLHLLKVRKALSNL
jgi:magnesium and cobalt transporter